MVYDQDTVQGLGRNTKHNSLLIVGVEILMSLGRTIHNVSVDLILLRD